MSEPSKDVSYYDEEYVAEDERDEELDDVLEFIHRLSCDALLTGKQELQDAYDQLQDRLRRQEHRR